MARIPLSQIPNAPALPDPVLTNYPKAQIDLSSVTRNLLTPTLSADAFSGPEEGMKAVGEALGRVPAKALAVIQHFQEARAAAQDFDSNNRAAELYDGGIAKLRGSLEGSRIARLCRR